MERKKNQKKKYPLGKLAWLWDNMDGHHLLFVSAMIGTVIYNLLQIVVPFISGKIIDMFLTGENAKENMLLHKDVFFMLLGAMIGLTVIRVVVVYLDCMAYEHTSQHVLYKVRNFLYDKIQRQDMTFYNTYRTGDLMTRVTGDLDAVRHMIAWVIRVVIESVALFITGAVFFLSVNVTMALCLLAVSPFVFLIIYSFRQKVAPMHDKLREKLSVMNTVAQENISGNKVIKAFAAEDREIEKFDNINKDYRDTNKATGLVWIKYFPFMEGFANMMPIIMLLVGGILLIDGKMTMGGYVAISGMTWALSNPMRNMGNILNEFQRFMTAADKIMEIYYSEPKIKDKEGAVVPEGRLKGDIEFKNVSFQYADGNWPVLKNINLKIKPQETIAIMGETGCGKTTLINLIPRFFEAVEGEILVDGINVNDYELKGLRKNIGFATQDVLLYSDTIEGNIAYGDGDISMEEVEKNAKYSRASEFIAHMPDKYDTLVGERGVGLSGGQKQRISLSRALAIKPSILILDDTTSAVDMETESKIQDSLKKLDFDCTKIIIAQRISTTRDADRIIILKDGEIIEEGNHEELSKKGGYYSELCKLQGGYAS